MALATTVIAQAPAAARGTSDGFRGDAARMLLANTGELGLTDQQVVRLAAIARRAEGRRASIRASLDSARDRFTQPGDSLARRQFAQQMRERAERSRDAAQTDTRDAIAVLNADQQAKAWQMVANRGAGARGMRVGGMRRGMRGGEMPRGMRRGFDRAPGARVRPGMPGRAPMRDRVAPQRRPDQN